MRSMLLQNESGGISILWALTLPVIVGFMGLAVDTSTWFLHQRNMQTAADVTAIATGFKITSTATSNTLDITAEAEATRNGFGAPDGVTVTTNKPPATGAYTTDNNAVEVILTRNEQRMFSMVYLNTDPTITARAVARNTPGGRACILSLDPTADDALRFQGNTTVSLNGCIAAANSNSGSAVNVSGDAITLAGNVTLSAQSLYAVGTYEVGGSSTLHTVDPPRTLAPPIPDPYAGLAVPSFSGCGGGNSLNINNTRTLNPGVYCNGLRFNANADVTLNPGVYYIDRGSFRINGGARVRSTGGGITFVLTSSTGSDYATVDINGGADVQISASNSGTYAGVLFYQDRRANPSGTTNRFNGNSTTIFNGAIYIPQQLVDFTGGNASASNVCTQVIARLVQFSGNANMLNNCTGSNQSDIIVPGSVRIVE